MEDKVAKFERLAEKRVNEALKKLRLIGNLANKRSYSYTNEHVTQIVEVLDNELKILKNRFKEEPLSRDSNFTFKQYNDNY